MIKNFNVLVLVPVRVLGTVAPGTVVPFQRMRPVTATVVPGTVVPFPRTRPVMATVVTGTVITVPTVSVPPPWPPLSSPPISEVPTLAVLLPVLFLCLPLPQKLGELGGKIRASLLEILVTNCSVVIECAMNVPAVLPLLCLRTLLLVSTQMLHRAEGSDVGWSSSPFAIPHNGMVVVVSLLLRSGGNEGGLHGCRRIVLIVLFIVTASRGSSRGNRGVVLRWRGSRGQRGSSCRSRSGGSRVHIDIDASPKHLSVQLLVGRAKGGARGRGGVRARGRGGVRARGRGSGRVCGHI